MAAPFDRASTEPMTGIRREPVIPIRHRRQLHSIIGQIRIPVNSPRDQRIPNQIQDRDRKRFGMQRTNRALIQIPELHQAAKVPEISNSNNQGNEDSNSHDCANPIRRVHSTILHFGRKTEASPRQKTERRGRLRAWIDWLKTAPSFPQIYFACLVRVRRSRRKRLVIDRETNGAPPQFGIRIAGSP
jgi:hypothetical protein